MMKSLIFFDAMLRILACVDCSHELINKSVKGPLPETNVYPIELASSSSSCVPFIESYHRQATQLAEKV